MVAFKLNCMDFAESEYKVLSADSAKSIPLSLKAIIVFNEINLLDYIKNFIILMQRTNKYFLSTVYTNQDRAYL